MPIKLYFLLTETNMVATLLILVRLSYQLHPEVKENGVFLQNT